ncbi:uncharacterized protein [Dermacentor albipictus]|uniref:uncharacterized protein n=1 Tax=Dermacentor albipictus TaxID=60249 RepID=UPI0038FCBFB7
MDIVHPSYVTVDDFTGEVAWIKQVVEEHTVCQPMAKVKVIGPFGELETEAVVSKFLSLQYAYIFSNRSNQLLCDKGVKLGEGIVQALTRGQARKIAALSAVNAQAPPAEAEKGITSIPESEQGRRDKTTVEESLPADQLNESVALERQSSSLQEEQADALTSETGSLLSPASKNFDQLLRVDRESLAAEQKNDESLAKLHDTANEGIATRNVMIRERGGLFYRHYRDRKGRSLDQLVVPTKYREDLLSLCHGNGWFGHLGINISKESLLMEYYWPGCFKDVENFVRSCDACQRSATEDPESWLETCERIATFNNCDSDDKLRHVYFALEGAARTWFENRKSPVTAWDLFRSGFLRTFTNVVRKERAEIMLDARVQLPNENIAIFTEEMSHLFHHADPDMSEKKVRLLMRGVKEELFAGMVRSPP